jgi:CRISPR-associated protein Cas1
MPKPIIKRMWQDIVKRKIENQAFVLKYLGYIREYEELINMKESVLSGDSTNVEARAAALYFKTIFGEGFTRRDDNYFYNSALNYGYAIVRGMISRSLVMYGFEPAIGIFHHNQLNSFNLSDDIIECFRPLVDLYIFINIKAADELDSKNKRKIYNVINSMIILDGKLFNTQIAIENVIKSLATSFEKKENLIKLPTLCDLKEYRYE